jgi:tetratricopeptide (TPR) repeat protein
MPMVTTGWRTSSTFFGERTTEAIALMEKAIRLNPRYPFDFPYTLGFAYSLVGRYEEAIACQKQALQRNPNLAAFSA